MPPIVDDDELDVLDDELDELAEDDAPELPAEPESPKAEEPAEKPAADTDEDDEPYGKRVKRRIDKLTAKMRQYEQETNHWKERVAELESKTKAKEMAEFQYQAEWSASELTKQIDQARAAKKAAIEEGDVDKQIKSDEQILELREQLAEKRRLATAAKEQATQFKETQEAAPKTPDTTIPEDLPSGTKQWLRANPWFLKNSDPRAVEFARTLDAALQEEGYSPEEPGMYAELDKRLQVLVPRLAKAVKSPPKPRVAGSSTDGQRADSSSKPSRKLTAEDLGKMRRYGMDPNKPEHRKAWLHRNDPL
jgi:hypothetical protein